MFYATTTGNLHAGDGETLDVVVCGYYVNLESLLNGFLKVKTREFISGNEKEIKDLVKEIKAQTDYIKKLNLKV